MRLRRVTLGDIPRDQQRWVLSGCPVYLVFAYDRDGMLRETRRGDNLKCSLAVFGWMLDRRWSRNVDLERDDEPRPW